MGREQTRRHVSLGITRLACRELVVLRAFDRMSREDSKAGPKESEILFVPVTSSAELELAREERRRLIRQDEPGRRFLKRDDVRVGTAQSGELGLEPTPPFPRAIVEIERDHAEGRPRHDLSFGDTREVRHLRARQEPEPDRARR